MVNIVLEITKTKEGYTATSPDVQGLVAFSDNFEKVVKIAKKLAVQLLETYKELSKNEKHTEVFATEKIIYPVAIPA